MTDTLTDSLADRFAAYRAAEPKARIRSAAAALGASEAELVATGVDGPAIPLRAEWGEILQSLEALGPVMALTRNDACVHEKHGVYRNVEVGPHGSLVLDAQIDLRIFLSAWAFGYAVEHGGRASLQFFDRHGDAVHKVFVTPSTDRAAYDALVARLAATGGDGAPAMAGADLRFPAVEPRPAPAAPRPDSEVDAEGFVSAWDALQDTHDFFPLLRRFDVSRTQALRLAEGRWTERLPTTAARAVLDAAAASGTPIMVFVGNAGCIQIHTGPVERLAAHGPWYNVLDEPGPDGTGGFNLHLDETRIAEAWAVVKPTEDGDVTAVECFDAAGEQIVQFFGARKPGVPELEAWREIVRALPRA